MTRVVFYAPASNPEAWLTALRTALPHADVRNWVDGDDQPADYAVVWKPPLTMLQMPALRRDLKAIFNLGAGVDGILQLGDGLPPGVPIVRLADAGMGMQMAEYVTHAVLRYFRRFDRYDMQARAAQWNFLQAFDKEEFSIGILGLGVLGLHVAQALAHFGFPLHGWSRSQKEIRGIVCHAGADGLDTLLRASRVVVCMLPLTPETSHILNRSNLAKMPAGSFLINVGRGAHVVEADLLELVQHGHIAAATLDVFDDEPLRADHPFWREPRISVTPHSAAQTWRGHSARQIADKIAALERGEQIADIVDPTRGY